MKFSSFDSRVNGAHNGGSFVKMYKKFVIQDDRLFIERYHVTDI